MELPTPASREQILAILRVPYSSWYAHVTLESASTPLMTNLAIPSELVEVLFGSIVRSAVPSITVSLAPNVYPRTDLKIVFLTGVPGLNQQVLVGTPQCE